MPYCPECGKEIERGVKFCPECGTRIALVVPKEKEKVVPPKPPKAKEILASRKGKMALLAGAIVITVIVALYMLTPKPGSTPEKAILLSDTVSGNYRGSDSIYYKFSLSSGERGIVTLTSSAKKQTVGLYTSDIPTQGEYHKLPSCLGLVESDAGRTSCVATAAGTYYVCINGHGNKSSYTLSLSGFGRSSLKLLFPLEQF